MCLCIDFLLQCRDFGGPASNFETSPYLLVGQGPGAFQGNPGQFKSCRMFGLVRREMNFPQSKKGAANLRIQTNSMNLEA